MYLVKKPITHEEFTMVEWWVYAEITEDCKLFVLLPIQNSDVFILVRLLHRWGSGSLIFHIKH